MKKIALLGATAALVLLPLGGLGAAFASGGDDASGTSGSIPGRHHAEPGDDHGRHGVHHARSQARHHEAGDDHGRHGAHDTGRHGGDDDGPRHH